VDNQSGTTDDAVDAMNKSGGRGAHGRLCDVSDPCRSTPLRGAVLYVTRKFDRIDIPGNAWRQHDHSAAGGEVDELSLDEWQRLIRSHTSTEVLVPPTPFATVMKAQKSWQDPLISHRYAGRGLSCVITSVAYCAAKGEFSAMTAKLSREWVRSNINVNAIAPSLYVTEASHSLEPAFRLSPIRRDRAKAKPLKRCCEGNPIRQKVI